MHSKVLTMPSQPASQKKPIIPLTRGVFATNLVIAREVRGAGWTQRYVAEKIGVTPDRISKWERGEHHPNLHFQQRLADLYFDGDVSRLYVNHAAGARAA